MSRNIFSDEACSICGDSAHDPGHLKDGHAYLSNADKELQAAAQR